MTVKVSDKFVAAFLDDKCKPINKLEGDIQNATKKLGQVSTEIMQLQLRLNESQTEHAKLSATDQAARQKAEIEKDWQAIRNLQDVTEVEVVNDSLLLTVEVRVEHGGRLYDFGDYRVILGKEVCQYPSRHGEYGNLHGHRLRSGVKHNRGSYPDYYYDGRWFCFGPLAEKINSHIRAGRFDLAAELAVAGLHYVNPDDRCNISNRFREVEAGIASVKQRLATVGRNGLKDYTKLCLTYSSGYLGKLEQIATKIRDTETRLSDLGRLNLKISGQLEDMEQDLAEARRIMTDESVDSELAELIRNFEMLDGLTKVSYDRDSLVLDVDAKLCCRGDFYDRGSWRVYVGGAWPSHFGCEWYYVRRMRSGVKLGARIGGLPGLRSNGNLLDITKAQAESDQWLELAAMVVSTLNSMPDEYEEDIPTYLKKLGPIS
jgi:phage shock protein A